MTTRGSLPNPSVHGTWSEDAEIWDADTDTLMDLSTVTEATLELFDPCYGGGGFAELKLTMSGGDITIPSQGTVQWRVERGRMSTLIPKLYEIVLTLENDTDVVPILIGTVSVVGAWR